MNRRRLGLGAALFIGSAAFAGLFQNCSQPYALDETKGLSVIKPIYSNLTAGRSHACAFNGKRWGCWGDNAYGALGNGSASNPGRPVEVTVVPSTDRIDALYAGQDGTCAVASSEGERSSKALCWGRNSYGQLGDGETQTSAVPKRARGITTEILAFANSGQRACASLVGGVLCWGRGDDGQLGSGLFQSASDPDYVYGIAAAPTMLAAGPRHSCAVVAGGVKCWGAGESGALGDGAAQSSALPVDVQTLGSGSGVARVYAGDGFTCAQIPAGPASGAPPGALDLVCWGASSYGQLGITATADAWVPGTAINFGVGKRASAVALGYSHACAIVDGGAKCWGSNLHGELGDGTTLSRATPADVRGLGAGSGVTEIAAGESFSCAVVKGTKIVCWGADDKGQAGDGGPASSGPATRLTPVNVLDI